MRTAIIASTCSDMGACLMCDACGHVFLPSKPLSDMSEPLDNITLGRALINHACSIRSKEQNRRLRGGR